MKGKQYIQNIAVGLLSNMDHYKNMRHLLHAQCWLPMEYQVKFDMLALISLK